MTPHLPSALECDIPMAAPGREGIECVDADDGRRGGSCGSCGWFGRYQNRSSVLTICRRDLLVVGEDDGCDTWEPGGGWD